MSFREPTGVYVSTNDRFVAKLVSRLCKTALKKKHFDNVSLVAYMNTYMNMVHRIHYTLAMHRTDIDQKVLCIDVRTCLQIRSPAPQEDAHKGHRDVVFHFFMVFV